jgi:hypothetical protein
MDSNLRSRRMRPLCSRHPSFRTRPNPPLSRTRERHGAPCFARTAEGLEASERSRIRTRTIPFPCGGRPNPRRGLAYFRLWSGLELRSAAIAGGR